MTFRYWIWAETTGKTTELPFEKFEKTLYTFRSFISLGCYWLKFRNQLGINQATSRGKCRLKCNRILAYFGCHDFRLFVLQFCVCADFLFAYTPKRHNASPVICSVMKNNWKHLKPKSNTYFLSMHCDS